MSRLCWLIAVPKFKTGVGWRHWLVPYKAALISSPCNTVEIQEQSILQAWWTCTLSGAEATSTHFSDHIQPSPLMHQSCFLRRASLAGCPGVSYCFSFLNLPGLFPRVSPFWILMKGSWVTYFVLGIVWIMQRHRQANKELASFSRGIWVSIFRSVSSTCNKEHSDARWELRAGHTTSQANSSLQLHLQMHSEADVTKRHLASSRALLQSDSQWAVCIHLGSTGPWDFSPDSLIVLLAQSIGKVLAGKKQVPAIWAKRHLRGKMNLYQEWHL